MKCMTEYRITKYNPANRMDRTYAADEWTSFSDIGKIFGGAELSLDIYLKTEQAYIDCCIELIDTAQISSLNIEQAEYYAENIHFPSIVSHPKAIRQVVTACLREQCWLKITSEDFYIHFGYDYYMYIGSVLPRERVAKIAAKYGLYCELYPSPSGQ